MKKSVLFMLSVLLMTAIFISACDNNNNSQDFDSSSETNTSSSKASNDDSTVFETQPQYYDYSFNSYDDFQRALKTQESYEYTDIRCKLTECPKAYQNLLSAFENNDIPIAIPQLNGDDMELRNKEGFENISLMTCEIYNMPWIWYFCVVNGYDLRVQVTYLSVIDNVVIDLESSMLDVLYVICPSAPMPDNYTQFESYSSVYEKDILLADGAKVRAMVMELKDSQNIYVKFHHNGMIITVYADAKLLSDSFWNSFGFDFR